MKIVEAYGFSVSRIRGSHHFLKHPDGRATVIPVHRGELIGPGLLNKIAKDTEIEINQFKQK
ncbi:MAG: type II toxin-antitoxin system HicA family toxin [Verrucomicrobiota bacterium]|nr:type II toxin-antitoxin system HicA family toxin [Verrucomicrobiota bacterium]